MYDAASRGGRSRSEQEHRVPESGRSPPQAGAAGRARPCTRLVGRGMALSAASTPPPSDCAMGSQSGVIPARRMTPTHFSISAR